MITWSVCQYGSMSVDKNEQNACTYLTNERCTKSCENQGFFFSLSVQIIRQKHTSISVLFKVAFDILEHSARGKCSTGHLLFYQVHPLFALLATCCLLLFHRTCSSNK